MRRGSGGVAGDGARRTGRDDPGLVFHVSTYSSAGCSCVEVAIAPTYVAVRDSKALGLGAMLTFQRESWAAFVDEIRSGRLTDPALPTD